jgi:hypothetical protein
MSKTHRGSCHCGRVTFELHGWLGPAIQCNCSLCRRKAALWHASDDDHFRILAGESELTLYQFNTMVAKHYVCQHCGVSPCSRPRIAPTQWVVNLRCVDGIDLAALKILHFDGEHWEDAARQFMAQRAARVD